MTASTELLAAVTKEVEDLHVFFERWFRGDEPEEGITRLRQHLGSSFEMVTPRGNRLGLETLLKSLRGARGSNASFRIEVRDVALLHADDRVVVARYQEWQWNAKHSTPADNARWSTVVFDRDGARPNGLTWRWLQETFFTPAKA